MNSLAKIFSAELDGISANLIEVEVDINVGLHSFTIVGLADMALKEAKERVNSALKNSGLKPPNRENRKITVNLAPADVKKAGSQYDLAIALGYALATKQIKEFDSRNKIFAGELALDGSLRPIYGALNIAELAKKLGYKEFFLPAQNAEEAAVIEGLTVVPLKNFAQAMSVLEGREKYPETPERAGVEDSAAEFDFSMVKGQENGKRALMIAAAGGHNLLMVGSPGAGKSLLAKAMVSILPDPAREEAIEITKIYSAAGLNPGGLMMRRPFRSPHHSASLIAIVGGGGNPKPGEISLAHRGILFLDELPEFRRDTLEALRQPLEDGSVSIARAKASLVLPAKFTLVAAMNPCPCGYFGDSERECRCTANEVFRYQKKISGPLLDRIDLQVPVARLEIDELRKKPDPDKEKESEKVKVRVELARKIQKERFDKKRIPIMTNSEMSSKHCEEFLDIAPEAEIFLKSALENMPLSARGYYRILKTARTIADLGQSKEIKKEHLAEAFSYRLRSE